MDPTANSARMTTHKTPSPASGPSSAPTEMPPLQQQSRPAKRSRVRQACNRCKARKIKCGDLRPCENCIGLGLVCKDWRPGEDPQQRGHGDNNTSAVGSGYGSGSDHEPHQPYYNQADDGRSRSYSYCYQSDGRPARQPTGPGNYTAQQLGLPHHESHGSALHIPYHGRSIDSDSAIPWPNTPYERSTHSVAWPPRPDPKRHRYLAYPYDSIYRNEFGHLKALSLSSGLGSLSYLHEYHKLANEQFLDALWQVLEGDAQESGNAQMFALESELFSPHSLASLGQHSNASVHPLGIPHGPQPDWSLGGATSIKVPYSFDHGHGSAMIPTSMSTSSTEFVSPAARLQSRSATTSPSSAASASSAMPAPAPVAGRKRALTDQKSEDNLREKTSIATRAKLQGDIASANTPYQGPPQDLWVFLDSKVPPHYRRSLLNTFLTTSYVLWPTFILSEFLETLKDAEQRRSPTFVCLVIACCAIAARQEGGGVKGGAAAEWGKDFGFFELYLDIRRLAPRHTDWASLNHIQALFYLSHYCFGASGPYGVTRAHYLINGCVSKCFDVGLHRSAETYTEAFTESEIEARRRTLWAVYCGDKVSAAYGRPVMLRLSDIDVAEINVDSPKYDERLPAANSFDQACTLRPFHRAAIRLFCVLERVIDKINLPACSSSAALERVMRKKPKRPRQSENHDDSCMADHEPIGFSEELELVDSFQTADTPTSTTTHQDDTMFHAHIERLRTTSAFIKVFIYRHLFCMANTNLSREPPRLDYRDEMVRWCRELLLSQRKMIQRGEYTDFGSVMSYQLSQTGRGLIPAIYISSRLMDPTQDPNSTAIIKESKELLVLAYDLLRQLSTRFTASNRQLQIMQQAFKRLDLSLKKRSPAISGANSVQKRVGTKTGLHESVTASGAEAEDGANAAGMASNMPGLSGAGAGGLTSGLNLIAGVAGTGNLDTAAFEGSGQSNEEDEDDYEDETDRDKKPGWISDLPINQPVEKAAPHNVNAFVSWSTGTAGGSNSGASDSSRQ